MGRHPEFDFRGGWAYPGLMLVSGVFQKDVYPLLNGGTMVGWLSVCFLLLGIRYLASESRPWLFTATFCLFLASSRFMDFLLNCKFSVLGICLYALFVGLVSRYLRAGRLPDAFWAGFILSFGWGTGKVAVFYGLITLVLLACLFRKRIVTVLLSTAFFSLVFLVAGYNIIAALLLVPLLPLLAASALRAIQAFGTGGPYEGPGKVEILGILLGAAFLLVAAGVVHGYDGYFWYKSGQIARLFTDGYGFYSVLFALLAIAAGMSRERIGDAVLVAAVATGALVPVAVIEFARNFSLPTSVPGVLLYEIGRDTSLYFVPLALCWTGAALTLRAYGWLNSNLGSAYGNALLALVLAGVVFVPSARQPGSGGWERVSFLPLSQTARALATRADNSRQTADSLGPAPVFNPLFFDFGRSELLVSRALGDLGAPRDECFVALIPEKALWNDPQAQDFFEWAVILHLFPFVTVTTDPDAAHANPACAGKPILLVHNSARPPATADLERFQRAQRIGNYTIYSK